MARPIKQRRNYAAGGADKKTIAERRKMEENIAKDYKAYREAAKAHKGEERKDTVMDYGMFRKVYEEYYAKEKMGRKDFDEKNVRGSKIGEDIYQFETSGFTEKQYDILVESIKRAREELTSGDDKHFTGKPEDIVAFLAESGDLDEKDIKARYSSVYMALRNLFDSKEEFNAWISPTVNAFEI